MINIRPYQQHTPSIPDTAFIDPNAVIIGQVDLGPDVSVWPMVVIRGDVNHISIGGRTNIQDGSILHVTHQGPYDPDGGPLRIGHSVTIGHGAVLHACHIGDYCLVGMGSTVLDKAVMEPHSMLAGGAVLPPGKVVKSQELWAGNPAKKLRNLTTRELESLAYSADHYVKLKNEFIRVNDRY